MPAKPPAAPDLDKAYEAFDEGRYETALGLADKALKGAPRDRDAWLLRAACMDALGDPEAAMKEYEGIVEEYPDDAETWVRMADLLHHGAGDLEGAIAALEAALEAAEPQDDSDGGDEEMAFEAHLRFVDVFLDAGDLDQALRHAEVAREMDKHSPDAEVARGQVLFELGRLDEVEKAAARAIDKDPRHGGAWFLRSLVLERRGDMTGARRAVERAATLEPEVFQAPVDLPADDVRKRAAAVLAGLPPRVKEFLAPLAIEVQELPADADLASAGGAVHPTARVALRAPTLDKSPDAAPEALVIYRLNAVRGCGDVDSFEEVLGQAMALEAAQFLDLDDDELDSMLD